MNTVGASASVAYAIGFVLVLTFVLIRGWRSRPIPRERVLAGLLFSALVLFLQLPGITANLLYLDPAPLLDEFPEPLVNTLAPVIVRTTVATSLVSAMLFSAWRILVVPVAEEAGPTWPILLGHRPDRQHLFFAGAGLVLGVALAGLSPVAVPNGVDAAWPLFPAIPDLWRPWLTASAAVTGAITEEAVFRGVLQRHLSRHVPAAAAIVGVALLVACGQALSASPVQLLQVLAIGVVAGIIARRYSTEHAILAHVGLNLSTALFA